EGRGHALVYAPGEIELRLMARTEEPAEPIGADVGRGDFRAVCRRTAEMGANADGNLHLRLDRPIFVLAILRLLRRIRFRIGEPRIELRQIGEHLRRAPDEPDDFAAPFDVDFLSRLDLADVDLDRRAGRLRTLARLHRHHA